MRKKKADKGGDEVWTNRWSGEPKGFANPSRLPPPVNIGSSSTRHPIISPDALTLLATSTRKGSQSGDIWMFTRPAIDQPFSTVERLAEPVNTSDWDMPSFVSNDRLFVIAGSQHGSDMGSKKDAVREYRYFTRAKASDPFGPGRPLGSSLLENKTVDSNGSFRLGDGGRAPISTADRSLAEPASTTSGSLAACRRSCLLRAKEPASISINCK